LKQKTQAAKTISYLYLVAEIARRLFKLAATDTPSGSSAASRYATDENATSGAGNLGPKPAGKFILTMKFRWTLFFCQEG
jgi:hypothetical protein